MNVEKVKEEEEEEADNDFSLVLPYSELRTTAVKRRGLKRRSHVGVQKRGGKGSGCGEDVGGAGMRIKIDLLQH